MNMTLKKEKRQKKSRNMLISMAYNPPITVAMNTVIKKLCNENEMDFI